MNNTAKIIAGHAKNGVVLLSVLKKRNYPLFKYFLSNFKWVRRMLQENGLYVLNDLRTLNNTHKIKYYLLYHYGNTVNLSVMRQSDRNVYNYLSYRGKPEEVIEHMGFQVVYNRKSSAAYIKAELYRLADSNGVIHVMNNPPLYSKLYYQAKKRNVTVSQYIQEFGFSYHPVNQPEERK